MGSNAIEAGGPNVALNYVARAQFWPFHKRTERFALIVAHRRAGKTRAVIADMVVRALRTKKKEWFGAYIAPTFGQAKNIAWAYIKQEVRNIPGCKISESECSVVLPNGSKLRCFGVDNPDALRGLYFDHIVADEFAEWEGRAYTEVIRPALADRYGTAVFIGTPKGPSNKFAKLREKAMDADSNWFYLELKASETGILPQSELDELRQDMDSEEYAQELECSFTAANRGTYYAKHISELERRGAIVEDDPENPLYDPYEKVSIAIDFGFRDATAIWFWQVIAGEVRFIDYWEETGYDAQEVAEVLELKPYAYETWWVPHDALHHTSQSRKSIIDQFRELNAPARKVPNPDAGNRVIHGVNAVRKTLRTYPLKFVKRRTARGLEALRNYARRFNADDNVLAEKAKHDEWSHGADAFRYACLCFNQSHLDVSIERAQKRSGKRPVLTQPVNTQRTFEQALAEHQQRLSSQRLLNMGRY